MEPVITGRDQGGRFTGSGNPRGRPVGARDRVTMLLDRMAEKGAKAVLDAVMTAAQAGDVSAATLVLSRVWPARKGRPIRLELPDLLQPGGAPAALAAIARMAAEGIISVEEAGELARVAETYMRATDTLELLHRIEKLETALAGATVIPGPNHAGVAIGAAIRRNGGAAV